VVCIDTEEELDLLQFAAGGAAQSGTASAQVVRRELADACLFRELLNDVPGKFLGHPVSPSRAGTAHTTEHLSSLESCSFDPRAEFAIDQSGTGAVRTWPPLPPRSTIAQRPSRC